MGDGPVAVGEAEGIWSEAKVPERGVEMGREGSPLAGPEAAVSGANPRAAPVLEFHQPGAALHHGSRAGRAGRLSQGHFRSVPREVPSLGLSGFSLRLGVRVATSPGSGG